jgi:hypothetical protein
LPNLFGRRAEQIAAAPDKMLNAAVKLAAQLRQACRVTLAMNRPPLLVPMTSEVMYG